MPVTRLLPYSGAVLTWWNLPAGQDTGKDVPSCWYISGMPALDSAGKFAPGAFEEEADRAWANLVAIARGARVFRR